MAQELSISEATLADVDDLVSIYCDAMEEDIVVRFMYGHRRKEAVGVQTESFTPALCSKFTSSGGRCHIIKAVDKHSGQILGWSLARWEDGGPVEPPESIPGEPTFLMHYWRQQNRNWTKLMAGKKHVVIGSLYVQPGYQRHGLGRKLVGYLFEHYGLEKEVVFVQTLASSEGFYRKLGWETADSTDIDLSEWGGKDRGYGIHRSPQMLRQPAPFKSLGSHAWSGSGEGGDGTD